MGTLEAKGEVKMLGNLEDAVSYSNYMGGVRPSVGEDIGNKYAYAKYSAWRKEREARVKAEALLDRFVDVYGETALRGSMIADGRALWRDYYEWTGDHMILTDEGWERGEVKESYLASGDSDAIIDEVNAPVESL